MRRRGRFRGRCSCRTTCQRHRRHGIAYPRRRCGQPFVHCRGGCRADQGDRYPEHRRCRQPATGAGGHADQSDQQSCGQCGRQCARLARHGHAAYAGARRRTPSGRGDSRYICGRSQQHSLQPCPTRRSDHRRRLGPLWRGRGGGCCQLGAIPEYSPDSPLYDPTIGTTRGTLVGKYSVKEVYGEVHVPILKNTPFFDTLSIDGALRLSDYSTAGSTTTWKVGGEWAPIPDIRFRAT